MSDEDSNQNEDIEFNEEDEESDNEYDLGYSNDQCLSSAITQS